MTLLRIKRWLIHKLGGFMVQDLPTDLAVTWLHRQANATLDHAMDERLREGFKTKYI